MKIFNHLYKQLQDAGSRSAGGITGCCQTAPRRPRGAVVGPHVSRLPTAEAALVAKQFQARPRLATPSATSTTRATHSVLRSHQRTAGNRDGCGGLTGPPSPCWEAPPSPPFPIQYLEVLQADYGLAGDDLDSHIPLRGLLAASLPDHSTPGLVYRGVGDSPAM